LQRKRVEALEDLKRAETRLEEVDNELEELERSLGGVAEDGDDSGED
jgi:chromosome segregation ATPase